MKTKVTHLFKYSLVLEKMEANSNAFLIIALPPVWVSYR